MNLPPIDIPRLLRALGISRVIQTDVPPDTLYAMDVQVALNDPVIEYDGETMRVTQAGKVTSASVVGLHAPLLPDPVRLVLDGVLDMDAINEAARDLATPGEPLGIIASNQAHATVADTPDQIMANIRDMMRTLCGPWYVTLSDQELADQDAYVVIQDSLSDARQLRDALNEHIQENGSGNPYRHHVYQLKYLED